MIINLNRVYMFKKYCDKSGETKKTVCGVLLYASLYGTTTAYIITSATSIRYFLFMLY